MSAAHPLDDALDALRHLSADEERAVILRLYTVGLCRQKKWVVTLSCPTCGRQSASTKRLGAEDLKGHPEGLTVAAFAKGAAWSQCGHKGAEVDFSADVSPGAGLSV